MFLSVSRILKNKKFSIGILNIGIELIISGKKITNKNTQISEYWNTNSTKNSFSAAEF